MSTALYRRYRPDTFADVIGQNHVTDPLQAALDAGRVSHAYLFSGPRGCGKTTCARIMARCLNCVEGPTSTPCGNCESCKDLAVGGPGSIDVIEIDAASHNGVDDARELRERAVFAPMRDRFKIFILDEAHMVTSAGFNALLKVVEEPPAHVKFIFATTEPAKVISTIRSRTHHYPFRLVSPEALRNYLSKLCEFEGINVAEGVLSLVLRAGGGSVRDSLSVLDQLMAGAVNGQVSYDLAVGLLGYTDESLLDSLIEALAGGDGPAVFRGIDRVIASGVEPRRFVEDLLTRLRDLLVVAMVGPRATDVLIDLSPSAQEQVFKHAQTLGGPWLSKAADVVNAGLSQMRGASSSRLQLELLTARLLLLTSVPGAFAPTTPTNVPRTPAPIAEVSSGSAPASAPAPASTNAAKPVANAAEPTTDPSKASAPAQNTGFNSEVIRARWAEVLGALAQRSRIAWSLVSANSMPGAYADGVLNLIFSNASLVQRFNSQVHEQLEAVLKEVFFTDIRCVGQAGALPDQRALLIPDLPTPELPADKPTTPTINLEDINNTAALQASAPPSSSPLESLAWGNLPKLADPVKPVTLSPEESEKPLSFPTQTSANSGQNSTTTTSTTAASSQNSEVNLYAQAAKRGEVLNPSKIAAPPTEEEASPDDLTVENSQLVGVECAKTYLGATVIEQSSVKKGL